MHTTNPPTRQATTRGQTAKRILSRRGFSTLELLVVAGILVLLLALAAGAVSTVVYSSQRSLAENQLRVGIAAARDAAIRSSGTNGTGDAAAVFYFRNGRTVMIPCTHVATLSSDTPRLFEGNPCSDPLAFDRPRELFAPIDGAQPILMPRGWTVRGLAGIGTLNSTQATSLLENGWYDWLESADTNSTVITRGVWLFPETDFVPRDVRGQVVDGDGDEGWRRQSFMLRFEAGTGNLRANDSRLVLVLDPLDAEYRDANVGLWGVPGNDVEEYASLADGARRLLGAGAPLTLLEQQQLLGDQSSDTILVGPVFEIALTDERRLANAIGASGLNRTTQSLYEANPGDGANAQVPLDSSLFSGLTDNDALVRINDYISRRTGVLDEGTVFEARVFTVTRGLGQLQEVVER